MRLHILLVDRSLLLLSLLVLLRHLINNSRPVILNLKMDLSQKSLSLEDPVQDQYAYYSDAADGNLLSEGSNQP